MENKLLFNTAEEGISWYADLILPIPLPNLYTYKIPLQFQEKLETGYRVVVQFGKRKIYTGIVKNIHKKKPEFYETKDVLEVLDDKPIVNIFQLKFWEWISEYYMCTLGEVYKAALPLGLKLESESKVLENLAFDNIETLNEKERIILQNIKKDKSLSFSKINSLLKQKQSITIIKSLLEKNAIILEEKLRNVYKPKYETYLKLSSEFQDEKKLETIFNSLSKTPSQLKILMTFLKSASTIEKAISAEVRKKDLLIDSDTSQQTLNELIKKNIFILHKKEINRLDSAKMQTAEIKKLNKHQQIALQQVKNEFENKNVVLLHGVTSSGKTEIYIHLIKEFLAKGKQVLYLLPEIALTAQIIIRLKTIFGNKTGIYHSKFSDSERVEIWNRIQNVEDANKYQIILGVRSSIFLPFSNLGLIIVDEEHENSYKQYSPAPRYNARDSAIVLANIFGAKTLLGTATPSLESFANCRNKKYALVELKQRYRDINLPEIFIANTREAYKKRQMKSHFTPLLLDSISTALKNKEQVILFQNRRGFSPYLECNMCGWIPKCNNCDVSLTYHKFRNYLNCHYCGEVQQSIKECKACGSKNMQTRGFGTEKIEDEISIYFENIKIKRMDLDSTRSKKAYEKMIVDFENGDIDILIGTQMITKGLDFDNVSLVGILNADNMLNFPDFRSFERSFQLMAQVSGRAGRKNKQGKVIIQTANPNHQIIQDVVSNNYLAMFESQMTERQQFNYPPVFRLIKITVKHKDLNVLNPAADLFARNIRKIFGERVLGPEFPAVSRIQNWYLKNILFKLEKEKSQLKAKNILQNEADEILGMDNFKSLKIIFDVDPL